MRNILKKGKKVLRDKVVKELASEKPNVDKLMASVFQYEERNIRELTKLKRQKKATERKIMGALKQTIFAHGPITEQYISSATKRIYGSILLEEKPNLWTKIITYIKKILCISKKKQ